MERRGGTANVKTIAEGATGARQRLGTLLLTTAIVGCASIIATPKSHAQQAAPAAAASQPVTFSIPAQPLSSAINAFIRQTGWQITYTSELARGKISGAVVGSFAPAEALQRLVGGTGLRVRVGSPGSAALIDPSVAAVDTVSDGSLVLDTIDVQGQAETAWGPVNGYVAKQSASGTKTDTPLILTPQSITVIGREQIDDQGATSMTQILRYAVGVKSDSGSVTNGSESFPMRGFNSDQYLDGLLNTDGWLDPFDFERIEVVRGPSSVLYGQASPAGLINSISKRPTETPLREVSIGTSEFGGFRTTFDFGGPIDPEGKFLYRLTGVGKSEGTEFGNDIKYERINIAPAITWRPDNDTTLTILAKYQYDPKFPALPSYFAEGTVKPLVDGTYVPLGFYMSDPKFDDSWKRQASIGYAFEHHFNDVWTVRQNLRYSHIDGQLKFLTSDWLYDTTYTRFASQQRGTTDTFLVDNNAEAKFSTGPLEHVALFGLDYRRINTNQKSGTNWGVYPDLEIHNPIYGYPNLPGVDYSSGTDQTSWQTGIYAQDQIKWDRLNFTFSGRHDWAHSDTTATNLFTGATTPSTMDDGAFTGRAGVVYLFDNGLAPYASYSTSFQPQSGTTAPNRGSTPFEPTTGEQYEIGIKYQPVGMDSFIMLSAYNLTRQNVLTQDPDNIGYQVQQGEVRSRGIELSGVAQLTDGLKLLGSFSYLDAKITKDNPNSAGISQVGKTPYATPSILTSLWIDYTFAPGALDGLGIGGGVRYIGDQWGDAANTFKTGSGLAFDAGLRYDFGKKFHDLQGLTLNVNAQNVFDERYVAGCYGSIICDYAPGRSVTGTLTYKW
ncbi:MAG: TonB-dependent siderophore receptor [Pseudomonadota bacterium]